MLFLISFALIKCDRYKNTNHSQFNLLKKCYPKKLNKIVLIFYSIK